MSKTGTGSIVLEFEGGGFVVVSNPRDVEIFLSRWDITKVEYVMLGGKRIEGTHITGIKGDLASGRVRYV